MMPGDNVVDEARRPLHPKAIEAVVRLRRLTKRFGEKTAVESLNLTVEAGTVFGLIGPNGAGKTTTFSMMAGYLRPSEGTVEVLGHAPSDVDGLRCRVGVLPQDAILPAADKVGELLVHMALLQGIPASKARGMAQSALAEVEGKDWWSQRCGSSVARNGQARGPRTSLPRRAGGRASR